MTNLLSANLFRLRRNPLFWVCAAGMLVLSAVIMVVWCMEDASRSFVRALDVFYFRMGLVASLAYAVFACLFLNTEYSDGAVRNKLAVGHTRRDIYLASFLTVFAASLCIALAWLAGGCAGVPFLGFLTLSPDRLILCMAVIVGFTAAFSAIFTFIGMLHAHRSVAVITILFWLALLLAASMINNALYEPEFMNNTIIAADGTLMEINMSGVQVGNPEPNPYYISGLQREVYEFLVDFLPSGQVGKMQDFRLDHPLRMLLSSLFITVTATLGGISLFERKDIK